MATKRQWLASQGLAKEFAEDGVTPARGRFSKDATAALAKAEAEGVKFDDPVKPEPKPRATPAPKPANTPVSLAKPTTSQQTAAPATPLAMPVREQKVGWAVERTPSGGATLIALSTCGSNKVGCNKPINFCKCADGPVAPHYLNEGVAGKPLALTKPLA